VCLCLNCIADPSLFRINRISPPRVRGICAYCGASDVPVLRLEGFHDPARRSLLTWRRWCEAAKREPAKVSEYAEMFYDLAVDLSGLATVLRAGRILYRARRGCHAHPDGKRIPYEREDIGAPPEGKRQAGRANREGRAVLYCADQEQTAVAEVRPGRGQLVSVCEARVCNDTKVLDLSASLDRGPLPVEQAFPWLEILGFLRAFEAELAHPLERDDAPSDYLPCQRFAESVEGHGVLGLRYRSSVHPGGANLVLFDPASAEILDSKLVQVTDTRIEYDVRPRGLFLPGVAE